VKTVELSEATGSLSEYAKKARKDGLVLTRRGRPVAMLVSVDSSDVESLSVSTNPDFLAIIERSRVRCKPGSGISTDEMRRRLAERRRKAG
jgi:prevent-host-death family protein